MKIKSILLQNFKGCRNATYTFDGKNVTVCGANGSGKTTISDGYYWLFSDRTTELKSNPQIRPIDVEECTPRYEVCFDVDGKPVTAAKIQKQTKKGNSVSISNTYEVNSVEYGERDFNNKMSEYNFDFDKFLLLSHPDAFIASINEKKIMEQRRNLLFAMASKKTDKEIASLTDGAKEVSEMLDIYTLEEIKAMQNSSLRKIKEIYGDDGKLIDAQIEGIENSIAEAEKMISDIDVAELELLKNSLNEQIADVKSKIADTDKQFEEYQKLSDGIMELKFAESDLVRKANEENIKARREIEDKIADKKFLLRQVEKTVDDCERQIDISKHHSVSLNESIESYRSQYRQTQELVFDENSLVCSYCGQEYQQDRKEQIKAEFESKKAIEIKKITELGNKAKAELDKEKETIDSLEKELVEHRKSLEMLNNAIASLENQLSELPANIDVTGTEEYKSIQSQIAEKEQAMSQMNSADEVRKSLNSELEDLQTQLIECEKKISECSSGVNLIESLEIQIDKLVSDKRRLAQEKADHEKILYEVKLVEREKCNLAESDINSHFDIVKFKFFDYQKNGEIKECLIATIDGKRFGESTNRGREILAKLDIIKGLQNFYGQYYPVFLDNAESLSEETLKRIDMPCQLIKLKVSDDKNLRIEVA